VNRPSWRIPAGKLLSRTCTPSNVRKKDLGAALAPGVRNASAAASVTPAVAIAARPSINMLMTVTPCGDSIHSSTGRPRKAGICLLRSATSRVEPRIHVITLAVDDLERALEFYRDGLGLATRGVIGTEFAGDETTPAGAAVMFELAAGLTLALYPRTELAKDANIPVGPPKSGEFSIGQLVPERADVDALLARAEAAGATLTDEPHERPWGIYSGYFRDPDGHLWEIIWNPRNVGTS
jgi:uncharacterized protein